MNNYHKLALFIAVLLLSISSISAAIYILGDISDVELETMLLDKESSLGTSETMEGRRGRGETISVEGDAGRGIAPLYEIEYPPRTKYLRQKVGEIYEYGEWRTGNGHSPILYGGEVLQTGVSEYSSMAPVFFTVKPLFNLTGFIPTMISVVQMDYEGELDHYPSLQLFSSTELSTNAYGITYAKYEFSRVAFLNADLVQVENYLEIPKELDEKLREIATGVVKNQNSPWEKLKALELFLKKNYEYDEEYTGENLNGDPIENFLFNTTKGVCKHFNSAFALLARSIGIPTRIVTGFLISPEAGYQLVMPKDAHLWVEVPFLDLGWIVFDATPERMMPLQ
jgi:transglutaminase-like putative cysteine protease